MFEPGGSECFLCIKINHHSEYRVYFVTQVCSLQTRYFLNLHFTNPKKQGCSSLSYRHHQEPP
ncbi:hypothetical protein Hanom_Chr04g00384341 [Helianthus anomalus]